MVELSIIIPTFNRLQQLQRVLDALENQTFPVERFEVVVVSDGSNDGTNEYLKNFHPPFTFSPLIQSNQGPAAARNHGIELAQGKWILFLDDDVVPMPELVAEHRRMLDQDENIVVLGPMLIPPKVQLEPWIVWEARMLEKQYRAMQAGLWVSTARQFYTGNTSLARRHLVEAGGFDARFYRAEDVELAYRLAELGLRFVFVPEAVGYHYARRSFQSWFNIAYAYGRYDVIISQQKGRSWLLSAVLWEFWERSVLIQSLVRFCLGRPCLSMHCINDLKRMAILGNRVRWEQISQFAYSGIFNLRYYQGVADTLGGAANFWRAVTVERNQRKIHCACVMRRESDV